MPALPLSHLGLLGIVTLGLSSLASDEAAEPPQRFVLEIDGHEVPVVAGEAFDLRLGDRTLRARLRPEPTRSLQLTELSFDYPAHFTFEYEASEGLEIWTLDGRDATLMVYRFDHAASVDELLDLFAEGVHASYPDTTVAEERATLRLADHANVGRRLTWRTGAIESVQEVYVLDPSVSARRVLVLQNTLAVGDEAEGEFHALRGLLRRTYGWLGG